MPKLPRHQGGPIRHRRRSLRLQHREEETSPALAEMRHVLSQYAQEAEQSRIRRTKQLADSIATAEVMVANMKFAQGLITARLEHVRPLCEEITARLEQVLELLNVSLAMAQDDAEYGSPANFELSGRITALLAEVDTRMPPLLAILKPYADAPDSPRD